MPSNDYYHKFVAAIDKNISAFLACVPSLHTFIHKFMTNYSQLCSTSDSLNLITRYRWTWTANGEHRSIILFPNKNESHCIVAEESRGRNVLHVIPSRLTDWQTTQFDCVQSMTLENCNKTDNDVFRERFSSEPQHFNRTMESIWMQWTLELSAGHISSSHRRSVRHTRLFH